MGLISKWFSAVSGAVVARNGSVMVSGDNNGVVVNNGKVASGDLSGARSGSAEVGSMGPKVDEPRAVQDFDAFAAGGRFEVEWSEGPASARVSASANIQGLVELRVAGGTLSIEFERGRTPKDPIKVVISSPRLARVEVSGRCQARIGEARMEELSVAASGSAQANVAAVARRLSVNASGAAGVEARFAGEAKVESSGASKVEVEGFGVLVAKASGSSEMAQNGGLCHGARLWSSGSASIKAQLDGVDNTYESSGSSGISCGLAGGASITGRESGSSDCSRRALSEVKERTAREHGAGPSACPPSGAEAQPGAGLSAWRARRGAEPEHGAGPCAWRARGGEPESKKIKR